MRSLPGLARPFAFFAKAGAFSRHDELWGRFRVARACAPSTGIRFLLPIFAGDVMPKTAPRPIFRRGNQPTFHRIPLQVAQFLDALALRTLR